jgi:hypothetical protein
MELAIAQGGALQQLLPEVLHRLTMATEQAGQVGGERHPAVFLVLDSFHLAGVMILVLPLDTVVRILEHATTTSGAAAKVGRRRASSASPTGAGPALPKTVIWRIEESQKGQSQSRWTTRSE